MTTDLTSAEVEVLAGLLEAELEEVRSEFHHTQTQDYRDGLRERERIIRGLLAKLAG